MLINSGTSSFECPVFDMPIFLEGSVTAWNAALLG
jgi:hypothetical protein